MQSFTAETQMLRDKINKKPRKRSVFGALWRALTLQRRASPAYARSFAEAKLHGTAFLLNGRRTRKKRREAAQEGRLCELRSNYACLTRYGISLNGRKTRKKSRNGAAGAAPYTNTFEPGTPKKDPPEGGSFFGVPDTVRTCGL